MKALLIVLPSSLDDYGKQYGQDAERNLAHSFFSAIEAFPGPVYILDQTEPLGRQSAVLQSFGRAIRYLALQKDIRPIIFSKFDTWSDIMKGAWKRLTEEGVDDLVVGGVWFDPNLAIGPTTEIYNEFSRSMNVEVNPYIVGRVPA